MSDTRDLAALRREYADRGLDRQDLGDDPIAAFLDWYDEAERSGLYEPNAMVLTSVGDEGPSSRMLLLKHVDRRGFVFYTNYDSRKAAQLDSQPACALLFPWHPLQRQVRVEGTAARLPDQESDAYFASRPRGSQLGAWASPQSQVVPDREFLDLLYSRMADRFAAVDVVPRPEHWGGYVVRPRVIEFWQGRPGRMHDRLRYTRADDDSWTTDRLAP